VIDLDSAGFKRSLAEAIAWCATLPLTNHLDEPAVIRYRRALVQKSHRLFRRGYERLRYNWQELTQSEEWHQSRALLQEADPLSLSTLDAQLRSAPLKPSFAMDEFANDKHWADAVAEVVAKRSQLLGEVSPENEASAQTQGPLLLFVPSETLMDGAAKYSSNGFFDVNNVPPWDTWVSFSGRTLLSWVPPVLMETAQRGIDANPEACINWIDRVPLNS
jgi:hypothetical protein